MWTMNVVDEREDSVHIEIKRGNTIIDARELPELLNDYEKRIARLAETVEDLRSDNRSLGLSNLRAKTTYEELERDYGYMHKKLSNIITEKHKEINRRNSRIVELSIDVTMLKDIIRQMQQAGDGLTTNPEIPGYDKRERAWVEAVKRWESYVELADAAAKPVTFQQMARGVRE